MRARKRPVIVNTIQWTGENVDELTEFIGPSIRIWDKKEGKKVLDIFTLEGVMRAQYGDWIIKGVEGEFYPCNNRIFHATYELLDD